MRKQRESVYNAVIEHMGSGLPKYEPTKEQRAQIIDTVTQSILNHETDFSDNARMKYDTPEKVKSYTSGLVSNWLRKDKRLNGGVTYQPKNPGSRKGFQDPQVKALRQLLKIKTDPSDQATINEQLELRLSEIQAKKAKEVKIDTSVLPKHLVEELGLNDE